MKTLWICMLVCCMSLSAFGAISVQTNGENRTVTLQYTSTITRVNNTLEKAAENFYSQGIGNVYVNGILVPFDSLTNAQKLSVVDTAVKRYIIFTARHGHVDTAIKDAAESAESEDIFIEEE